MPVVTQIGSSASVEVTSTPDDSPWGRCVVIPGPQDPGMAYRDYLEPWALGSACITSI